MTSYANLKIRSKLVIGFATVVFIALTIGIFGYYQIHALDASDDLLFDKGVKPVQFIGNMAAHFQRLRVNLRQFAISTDSMQKKYYAERIETFRAEVENDYKNLEPALPDAEAYKLFGLLKDAHHRYNPHFNRILDLSKSNRNDEALKQLKSDLIIEAEAAEIDAIEILQQYLVANAAKISENNTAGAKMTGRIMLALAFGASLLAAFMATLITRSVANPLHQTMEAVKSLMEGAKTKSKLVEAIAAGDLSQEVIVAEPLKIETGHTGNDEAGMLLKTIVEMSGLHYSLDLAFAEMTGSLRHNSQQDTKRNWFKNGLNELNSILRGDKSISEVTGQALAFLIEYLGAGVGVFYIYDEKESCLHIAASYAFTRRKRMNDRIALGEGLAGQAALEKKMICLNNAPPDYLPISSGIGEAEPINIIVMPLLNNAELVGVLEIGSFNLFSDSDLEFLNQSNEGMAIAINVNKSRQLVNNLLVQTQSQAEELRVQQEELQQTNEELEERAQMLEQQREQIRAKNREVEKASVELQKRAEELERVSTYKSEFLANMSHELRTPLNSLMILSSLLKDNREGNLTTKQVEFAATINGAGRDLLNLINDILDLSKIESGHLEFNYEKVSLQEISQQIESVFNPITHDKGISFAVTLDTSVPEFITADIQRTQQILKNLLSNACKFTARGSVTLNIYSPASKDNQLKTPSVAFAVTDTGIGIPEDKQALIFNAFQQADGSTSRTYGGTGLGLSISRQLARSMGGEIFLTSETDKGSTFTLYLPVKQSAKTVAAIKAVSGGQAVQKTAAKPVTPPVSQIPAAPATAPVPNIEPLPSPIPDDRDLLDDSGKSILIIEDDLVFAGILVKLVRDRGFSALVATDGENGIAMAERYEPSAIVLDVMLPNIDGWGVMRNLKDNPATRHIPVHFITCLEERQKAMSMGAIGFITKPVSSEQMDNVFETLESAIDKTVKKLLIVEDDPGQVQAMVALLEEKNVAITVAESGTKAIHVLSHEQFDCIVLDLGLADMGAFELLEELKKLNPERRIPVIIHTGRELTHEDEMRLHHYAESIIIKGAKSPERLLNEVTLFLHLVETSLDPLKQRMIRSALDKEAMLSGKKVLIVDDDMRNIFSLSSALAEKDIIILEAENGLEALKKLDEFPEIDLVLMDIMMPEMDGYEAMRAIRKEPRFRELPIIALTAKAMKGDREECIRAGASDYIPKPVDMDKLFSLLRVWLYSAAKSDLVDVG